MLSSNCFFLFQFIWNCVHAEWVLKMVAPKNWVHILKGLEYRDEKAFFFPCILQQNKRTRQDYICIKDIYAGDYNSKEL